MTDTIKLIRAKRLAKKEKMDKLTTGNFSIWQMSKCLGPNRSRKIGLEMQRILQVGEGPVKSVFLVESQSYQSRSRKLVEKKKRETLFKLEQEYNNHVNNRKEHFDKIRKENENKIDDNDTIYLGYATKPRSGGYDYGRLFPSYKTIRASTAPTGKKLRHNKKWDQRFGTANIIRSSENRFLSTRASRRRHRNRKSSRMQNRSRNQWQIPYGGSNDNTIYNYDRPQTSPLKWGWAEVKEGEKTDISVETTTRRSTMSRSGLRPSYIPPTPMSPDFHYLSTPMTERPRTVSTPYARTINPPSRASYLKRHFQENDNDDDAAATMHMSRSTKFQYLKDIDKRSEEQLERAREIDEGYNMTVNHLENHPMWDKMFGSTEKANDSDDDDD